MAAAPPDPDPAAPPLHARIEAMLGPPLPRYLRNEFTEELGRNFLPLAVGGAVASVLALLIALKAGSWPAMLFALIAPAGFALLAAACWRARRPLFGDQHDRIERAYFWGTLCSSGAMGGLVISVMAGQAPFILETLVVMMALAVLGVGNGSGPGRPGATLVQLLALAVPAALGTLLHWPRPWNLLSFVGISVYAGACVALALRSYAALSALLVAREEQRSERLRTHTALQHFKDPLVLLNEQLEIVLINQSARQLLGLPDALPPSLRLPELLATAPHLSRASSDPEEFLNHAALLVAARQAFNGVLRLNDERVIDIECIPVPEAGWVAIMRDTTGERNAIAELNRELRRCPLTGLANRRAFLEELGQRLDRGEALALLLIDLDGFKLVNERHGHAIGDRLITRIGFRLRTADPRLMVARLTNDEFGVIAPVADPAAAQAVAAALQAVIDVPARFGETEVNVGTAIGIALAPDHAMLPESLMRAADLALLAAKAEAGSHIRLFQAQMAEAATRTAILETRVRAAIRAQHIDVAYQPMLDLASGRVAAVEALVRMPADLLPAGQAVDPALIVAIAESRGLIGQLRRIVLRQAAATLAPLPDHVALWVNISVPDLRQPDLVDEIVADLAEAGLAPGRFAIEVTESLLMTDTLASAANLKRLIDLGAGVAMDDFGSGFSSLERLGRLPITAVKIASGLLTGAADDPVAASIFRGAASLAQSLGVLLVAEGVEEPADLALVRGAGVERVQGYLFARPVPASELPAAIAAAEAVAAGAARAAA